MLRSASRKAAEGVSLLGISQSCGEVLLTKLVFAVVVFEGEEIECSFSSFLNFKIYPLGSSTVSSYSISSPSL